MLKRLLNKVKGWFAVRELNRQIANEELTQLFKIIPTVTRESHETYAFKDFTCTVVGSKAELDLRMLVDKVNKNKKANIQLDRLTAIAFDNLVKVDE